MAYAGTLVSGETPRSLQRATSVPAAPPFTSSTSSSRRSTHALVIVSSAFVYAGQKCSAAARVLVDESIADHVIERVAGAVRVLVVGQASSLGTDVPPVIEQEAQDGSWQPV